MKRVSVLAVVLALWQSSCVVAGGYSSRDGWFFWPGGLGLIIMVVLVLLLLRSRRGR